MSFLVTFSDQVEEFSVLKASNDITKPAEGSINVRMIVKLLWQWHRWRYFSPFSCLFVRFLSTQLDLSSTLTACYNRSSKQCSYMDKSQKFHKAMKACASLACVRIARKIHAQLISTGLGSSTFLQNHLIHMYFSCHLVHDAFPVFSEIKFPNVFSWNMMLSGLAGCGWVCEAAKLFGEMPQRDVVSWNTMMSGYFDNGRPRDSIKLFVLLLRERVIAPGLSSFSCVMKACASLGCLRLAIQLHGSAERHGFSNVNSVQSSILDMYIKCGAVTCAEQVFLGMENPNLFGWNSMIYGCSKLVGIDGALDLFYQMLERDDVSWSTIISLLFQHGRGVQTLNMFVEMWSQGFLPNSMTYATVISACTSLYDLDWGRHLHARILRIESSLDTYTGSALIDLYAKCGCLESAKRVFDCLTERNVVSWTSLIAGSAQFGLRTEALLLFDQMRKVSVAPDEYTVATVLGACTTIKDSSLGLQLHGFAVKTGIDSSIPVENALITMYGKVGLVHSAEVKFDLMPFKDIISWTAMITAFSLNSNVAKAREYFDKMPEQNVVTWNSMMAAYIRNGFWEEGLKLHILMVGHDIKPDSITFATSVSACADSALLKLGKQIIAQAEKSGFGLDVSVANSAITMYSKSAQIKEAEKVFDSIVVKNLISWNSLMAGYAQNGQGMKVIEMFETMLLLNYTPDDVSYVSLLMGCSHAGLVEEGCHYFNSMMQDHGICPSHEHYACMVDMLGRAGFIEQALTFIAEMPFEATSDVWGALLAACRIHRNTKLVEFAARQLLDLEVKGSGSYSLVANMYLECEDFGCVSEVRKMMREEGIQKNPGCSWIDVHSRVHVFTADCRNHPQMMDVLKMLEKLWIMEDVESNGKMQVLTDSGIDDMLLV